MSDQQRIQVVRSDVGTTLVLRLKRSGNVQHRMFRNSRGVRPASSATPHQSTRVSDS